MVEARQEQQSAPRDRESVHVIDVCTTMPSLPLGLASHYAHTGIGAEKTVSLGNGHLDAFDLRAIRS
jgi:hypothetical protein